MDTKHLSNDELKAMFDKVIKDGWDRAVYIEKNKKKRHEGINFTNVKHENLVKELQQEMKNRGM